MALDVGDRTIGVAVSDPLALFARPERTLARVGTRRDVAAVADLVALLEATVLVVGHPLLPSGDRGEQARKVEAFVEALAAMVGVPVVLWDESYTTREAEARRRARGARERDAGAGIDAEAAAVILEEWLRSRPAPVAPPREPNGGNDEPEQ